MIMFMVIPPPLMLDDTQSMGLLLVMCCSCFNWSPVLMKRVRMCVWGGVRGGYLKKKKSCAAGHAPDEACTSVCVPGRERGLLCGASGCEKGFGIAR